MFAGRIYNQLICAINRALNWVNHAEHYTSVRKNGRFARRLIEVIRYAHVVDNNPMLLADAANRAANIAEHGAYLLYINANLRQLAGDIAPMELRQLAVKCEFMTCTPAQEEKLMYKYKYLILGDIHDYCRYDQDYATK